MRATVMWIAFLLSLACTASAKIVQLDESNWQKVMTGEWMIEFFGPWCPACRALHPTWAEFSEWSDDLGLDGIAQVDVTENPGLSGRFLVTALPTIYHVKDGEFRQYRGPRDKENFISFVEDRKYRDMETLPSWKHPNTVQMSLVSYFYKMSMVLRQVNQTITEDYGYPYWVSYLLFAVATIMFGAFLGLVLVCCVDFCFPYKHQHKPLSDEATRRKKDDDAKEVSQKQEPKDETEDDDEDESEDDNNIEDDTEGEVEETKEEEEDVTVVRKRRAKKAD